MYGSRFGLEVRDNILGEPVYDVDKRVDVRNPLLKEANMLNLRPSDASLIGLTC
jgi:hypothetical protein